MLLLAFLTNISLSLALVANRAPVPSRFGVGANTPVHPTQRARRLLSPPLSLSHPLTRNKVLPNTAYSRNDFALSATASASPASSGIGKRKTITATALLILLDMQFRAWFQKYAIPFPSSLAGCGVLFTTLILLNALNENWGEGLYQVLNPGATLLAKWLPVFFVPSLVALPNAGGVGDAREVLKVAAVIVGGFLFTLFTTAWTVLGVRKLGGADAGGTPAKVAAAPPAVAAPPSKPFGATLFRTLAALSGIAGASTVALVAGASPSRWINPLRSAYLLLVTLASFVFGANLPKAFTKAVHPLVTCTGLTWLAAAALSALTGSTFRAVLRAYRVGSLAPFAAGAGDLLLFLLGPAVVALACQMYGRRRLVRDNVAAVGAATLVSSVGGLYTTAAAVRLLRLGAAPLRLALLSRNITSPLALAIAALLGADASLAVTIVVLTGLLGANYGAALLTAAGITDPVARGLGIGAAAHGLGTAAFAEEPEAFPFAAIAMALTASACTVLLSVPTVRGSVVRLALGP